MAVVVNVDPNEVHAAASRWQMIGAEMGARGAPSVGISTAWPSAAATAGIHGQAAAATEAFQTRIGDTAATSQVAANAFQTQDTKVGVDAFKDVLSAVSSMIGMFSGSMGSVNAATSMLGQLTSTMFNLDDTDRFVKVLDCKSRGHTHTPKWSRAGPIGTAARTGATPRPGRCDPLNRSRSGGRLESLYRK